MISDKDSIIKDTYGRLGYGSPQGQFIILTKDGDVHLSYSCRDGFFGATDSTMDVMGFKATPMNLEQINEFFNLVHERIDIQNEIIFHKSNMPDVIVIEIPEFWRSHIIHRSLFTLLLRCASAFYHKGITIDEALHNYPLANQAKNALDFFLDGNIFPTINNWSSYAGFVNEFKGDSKEKLSEKLHAFKTQEISHFRVQ